MAKQGPMQTVTYEAGADLSSDQFKAVKFSSGRLVLCTGITDVPLGILQNAPDAAGKEAVVCISGITKINANEALAQGDILGVESDGQIQVAVATNKTFGVCLEAAGAAGEYATAHVNFAVMPIKA